MHLIASLVAGLTAALASNPVRPEFCPFDCLDICDHCFFLQVDVVRTRMMVQRRLQGGEEGVKMYKSTVHCAYHTVSKKCVYCTIFLGDQELLVFYLGGRLTSSFFLGRLAWSA